MVQFFWQPCGVLNFGLTDVGVSGHGKGPLKFEKKSQNWPPIFLQPFGALNFGFTDLGVTGYDNESFKFEKNGCCIKNVSNLLFDKFIFVSNGMWQLVMIIL